MKKLITIICAIFIGISFGNIQTVQDCRDRIIEDIDALENCKLSGTYKFVNGKRVKSAKGNSLVYDCSNGAIRIDYSKFGRSKYLDLISVKTYVNRDTTYTQIGTDELTAWGTFTYDDMGMHLEEDAIFPNNEYTDNYDTVVEVYRKIREKIK